jgi:hypothetical protein
MAISIPDRQVDGIKALLRLSKETTAELAAVLKDVPPTIEWVDFVASVSAKLSKPNAFNVSLVISTLFSLYSARADADLSVDDFIPKVIDDTKSHPAFSKTNENALKQLSEALSLLLNLPDTVGVTAKAIYVLTDHEKVLVNVRILTELRPIFGDSVADSPKTAVIYHMLHLHYYQTDHRRDICLAIDAQDLSVIRKQIDRAEAKAESLRDIMKKAGIRCLEGT